jgi:hypothetical protein
MSSRLTEVSQAATVPALTSLATVVQGTLLVRMIKPNLISSHNWHVQPSCQRSIRAVRLSGAPGIEARAMTPGVSSNLMRPAKIALFSALDRFCANFLNLSNFLLYVKHSFRSHLRPPGLVAGGNSSTQWTESADWQVVPNQHLSRSANVSNSDQHRSSR